MDRKTREVFERLVQRAESAEFFDFEGNGRNMRRALAMGQPIPESCKPGAMLLSMMERMTEEEKEALRELKSDDTLRYVPKEVWWELDKKK